MVDVSNFSPLWGEWYLKDRLGKGAFGAVYRAVKTEYGNTYISAIKHLPIPPGDISVKELISEGIIQNESSLPKYYDYIRDKIINEINMCYTLRGHTNIVSYEDHCIIPRAGGGYDIFIRMEFLTSLPDYMQMHKFTYDDVINLGIEICSALTVLKKHHMIHRDIKPANIFINAMGDFKLGDFGETKVLSGSTVGMTVRGTYSYMSPEISMGRPANITADIYSLGIVLYRLLNGNKSPFVPVDTDTSSSSEIEAANARRFSGERLPLPHFCDDHELAGIIMKACEFDSAERWQTPEEMKYALEELSRKKRNAPSVKRSAVQTPAHAQEDTKSASVPIVVNKPAPEKNVNKGNDSTGNMTGAEQESIDMTVPLSTNVEIQKTERKKKKWLIPVFVLASVAVVSAAVFGGVMLFSGNRQEASVTQENSDEQYERLLEKIKSEDDPDKRIEYCKKAINSDPERYEGYEALLAAYVSFGSEYDHDSKDIYLEYDEYTELKKITSDHLLASGSETYNSSDFADNVYYNFGSALMFSCDNTEKGIAEAKQWLEKAAENCSDDKKASAKTFLDYCVLKDDSGSDDAFANIFSDLVEIEKYAEEYNKNSNVSVLNMLNTCSNDLSENIASYTEYIESEDEITALAEAIEKDIEAFEKKNSGVFNDETEDIKERISEVKKALDPISYLEGVVIDETKDYYADIVIENYGTVTVKLEPEYAPITVRNFIYLAESGFYDGLTFHRIVEDFIIQGGDPNGDSTGGSEHYIYGEFFDNGYRNNTLSHTRGAVSMARYLTDYDSATSQFFIVLNGDYAYSLDGEYAVFGYVTSGMDIIDSISSAAEPIDSNGLIDKSDQTVISSVTIRSE